MRLLLDTNVVVAGLLWSGAPRKLLDRAVNDESIEFFSSPVPIDELMHTLGYTCSSRSAFAIPDQRSRFRDAYQALVRPVSPTDTPRVVHADGDDDYVATAALAANADLSVTGDDSLLGVGNSFWHRNRHARQGAEDGRGRVRPSPCGARPTCKPATARWRMKWRSRAWHARGRCSAQVADRWCDTKSGWKASQPIWFLVDAGNAQNTSTTAPFLPNSPDAPRDRLLHEGFGLWFGRSDGERDIGCGDQNVARHGNLAATAPNTALYQRDYRGREFVNCADRCAQRVAPAERIASAVGEFADMVPGAPNRRPGRCPQYHGTNLLLSKPLKRSSGLGD